MTHTLKFLVTVELDRESGKFASRDDMADRLREEIEGMDPGSIDGLGADGDSTYSVSSWNVDDA